MTFAARTDAALSSRPADAADGAFYDAIATEHGTIYGYGIVSAHSTPEDNYLVASSMAEHRRRRDEALAVLSARSVTRPTAGGRLSVAVRGQNPTDAAKLAVRMEEDAAVAWRAVIEQATNEQDRAFAVGALTECAVAAARWRRVLGVTPITVAFPGGSE